MSAKDLLKYNDGPEALAVFINSHRPPSSEDEYEEMHREQSVRSSRNQRGRSGYVSTVEALAFLDDEDSDFGNLTQKSQRKRTRNRTSGSDSHTLHPRSSRSQAHAEPKVAARRSTRTVVQSDDSSADDRSDSEVDDGFVLRSDVPPRKRQRSNRISYREPLLIDDDEDDVRPERASKLKTQRQGVRQSGRSTRYEGDMQDPGVNDIYRSGSEPRAAAPPKPVGPKEHFTVLPRSDPFRARHMQHCDSCKNDTNFAPLIYCQGCTFAYHKSCISQRSTREHLVTKIGDRDFVLQCRRCIAFPRRKEHTAPDQGKCSDCKKHGAACKPFKQRKTTAQEQKEREENGGDDPIFHVSKNLINNADNVLFRCRGCFRGFHFEHLPAKSGAMELDGDDVADQRFIEYSQDWQCWECETVPAKVSSTLR